MKSAKLKDGALLSDIRAAGSERESFHLWWLGQSGFLVQWQGRHLLLDPYLSDSLTVKYANTDLPHVRMTELVLDPVRFDFIDVVTSSHNHTDHLDADTLVPLLHANPNLKLVIPEANRAFVAERLKIAAHAPLGLNDGESVSIAGFKITAVPAAHETIERDRLGRCTHLGYVAQFGAWCVYHSGDTVWEDEIIRQLQPFAIDVALLPINGRKPIRQVVGNLNTKEAAAFGKRIGAKLVIPCHYDMFTFNTADPNDFAREAEAAGQPYRVLECGERWSSALAAK
ncbi:MBL fold metallo-hydrolase [candidate division KSB1 bacterium]|nr:MBL fold metallo-hydrolase [candidate division KSB1 bacterium]